MSSLEFYGRHHVNTFPVLLRSITLTSLISWKNLVGVEVF